MDKHLDSPIFTHAPDLVFTSLEGEVLPVNSVSLCKGCITGISLNSVDPDTGVPSELVQGDFKVDKELLYIPGIGHVPPGNIITYEGKDYILMFGWHKNVSNQTIYSWYMTPIDHKSSHEMHTLYYEMIDKIERVVSI